MLETVDFLKDKMPKAEYKAKRNELMEQLVVLQQQARSAGIGLVVLFEGWNGAGKGSRISDLMYRLDARATSVYVTEDLDVIKTATFAGNKQGVSGFYPIMQQFWKALGMRGTMTFYDRGWYTTAMHRMLYSHLSPSKIKDGKVKNPKAAIDRAVKEAAKQRNMDLLNTALTSVADFERQLTDDGYIVVKFFVHVTKKGQIKRLTKLRSNPKTAWRVPDDKLSSHGEYEQAYKLYDKLLEGSDFSYARWNLLNGEDKRRTNLKIAEVLVDALQGALNATPDASDAAAKQKAQANSAGALETLPIAGRTQAQQNEIDNQAKLQAKEQAAFAPEKSKFVTLSNYPKLSEASNDLVLDANEYKAKLKDEQKRLAELEMEMYQARVPLMVMFEGWDAAGKGGAIKRVAQALDARSYTIFTSPAPTKAELLHPHLWRYWTRLPRAGHVGIYDRSWYGRVLVERVEGFASAKQWARAYDEINEFEQEMVRWGAILLKFWVNVSSQTQLARFHAREENPAKQWKITEEDWRNRDKYPQYYAAVEDMFRLTSTPFAPWIVLESDDKYYARVKTLKTINDALESRLHT